MVEGETRFTSLQLSWLVAQSVYHPRYRLIFVFFLFCFCFGSGSLVNIIETLFVVFGVSS